MENAVQMKNGVLAVLAVAGSVLANALGGWDGALKVLVIMMVADYVTGLLVAALWHKSPKSDSGALDSRAGFKGIVRKCMILLLVWVAAAMDRYLGINFARAAVMLFFIGNEGLSLLENMGLMGVPYPQKFKNALEALKKQGNEGTVTHNG
jgi:toxin secretion/phage lysis holin